MTLGLGMSEHLLMVQPGNWFLGTRLNVLTFSVGQGFPAESYVRAQLSHIICCLTVHLLP